MKRKLALFHWAIILALLAVACTSQKVVNQPPSDANQPVKVAPLAESAPTVAPAATPQ